MFNPDQIVNSLEPDSETLRRSQRLVNAIRQAIDSEERGLSFFRFMELALYDPILGYYSSSNRIIGAQGDFVTAPEISPLFAWCLARQIEQILGELGGGMVLEVGAGTGSLAVEILLELERLGSLPERYLILEISPGLRILQREQINDTVPHLYPIVNWVDRNALKGFRGIILANEVLDALPVHRFSLRDGVIQEQRVVVSGDSGFKWRATPAGAELRQQIAGTLGECVSSLATGYCSEFNPRLGQLFDDWSSVLLEGVILCIDYGYTRAEYYHPQRDNGTLMCHYRHRAHPDPFILVGLQDITAFVDFTAVAEVATVNGLQLGGYSTQAHFLMACGLDQILMRLQKQEPKRYLNFAQQAKSLTLPGEMGERFKVIALTKDVSIPLMGFGRYDQRQRLSYCPTLTEQ